MRARSFYVHLLCLWVFRVIGVFCFCKIFLSFALFCILPSFGFSWLFIIFSTRNFWFRKERIISTKFWIICRRKKRLIWIEPSYLVLRLIKIHFDFLLRILHGHGIMLLILVLAELLWNNILFLLLLFFNNIELFEEILLDLLIFLTSFLFWIHIETKEFINKRSLWYLPVKQAKNISKESLDILPDHSLLPHGFLILIDLFLLVL